MTTDPTVRLPRSMFESFGAVVFVLLLASTASGCEQSVRLGDGADVLTIERCSGSGCEDSRSGRSDGEGADGERSDGGERTDRGERIDTGGGDESNGSTSMQNGICGLTAEQTAIVNGVMRAVARSLYETFAHSEEMRPALVLFPGNLLVDYRVARAEYENCEKQSRACSSEIVDCHGEPCVRCRAVECGPGPGSWTVHLWSAASSGSPEEALVYRTGDWRVEYTPAPSAAWDLSLAFLDSIRAVAEMRHDLRITSLRSGSTYDASFQATVDASKADAETSPDDVRIELRFPALPERGRFVLRTTTGSAVRPSGVLTHEIPSEPRFDRLDRFTIASGGQRISWEGDCSSF